METEGSGGLSGWLDANPTLALGAVIVIVLIVGGFLLSRKASTSTANGVTTNAQGQVVSDLSGLTNNAVYVPTQTMFSTYNSTDASQHVTNTGSGNVSTGSTSAGNTSTSSTKTIASDPGPIKAPPVQSPPKVIMQWNESYVTHGQSLDLVAKNASVSMNNDAIKYNAHGSFVVSGQQIYNANKSTVDAFWAAHKVKGNKTGTNVTGLTITIPHLVKQ